MYKGVLTKMRTEFVSPIHYYLELGEDELMVNELLGLRIRLKLVGYQCLHCGDYKKIYRQGHCYDCFYTQPQTADWIMRPELSTAHLDIEDRDLDFERKVQLAPHIVYLALSSNVKVGVTRKTQVPTRWIDQGAVAALEILEAPNRYLAGIAEVALKNLVADKTNWRKMLKNELDEDNLLELRDSLWACIPDEAKPYFLKENSNKWQIDFPVNRYPQKIKSLNLAKNPIYEGTLSGLKAQYFIFEDDTVFNIRGNEGSIVELTLL